MIDTRIKATAYAMSMLAAGISTSVHALKIDGSVGLNLDYTDNAALTSTGEVDDTIATASLRGSLSEDEGSLTGYLTGSVRHQDYLDNTFGEETYLAINANTVWEQIRNRLQWNLRNYYDQVSRNTLAANTPDNTEDTNAFSLSATATLPVAPRHTLLVRPSFSDFYYSTTNNDNQQIGLAVDWNYLIDPTVTLSLNTSFVDVNYDTDTVVAGSSADYETTSVGLGLAVVRSRTRYDLNVGFSEVERDLGSGSDGVVGRFTVAHDFTAKSSVVATIATDITDSSNNFLTTSSNTNLGSFTNFQTSSDVVHDNLARVTYRHVGTLVNSRVWAEVQELDYDSVPLDREVSEFGASMTYAFTPLVSGIVDGRFVVTKEDATATTDKEYLLSGRVNYSLTRKLSANAGVQVQTKDSSNVPLREYDEFRVFAGVGYQLGR